MFGKKKKQFPVGIDLSSAYLKAAQIGVNDGEYYLNAAEMRKAPDDIQFGTGEWQRWAVTAAKECFSSGKFAGKSVMASIPCENVFIEQVKIKTPASGDVQKPALEKIDGKLPFSVSNAMANTVITGTSKDGGETEVLVMAVEKDVVSRQLAIYEKAGLDIKGITAWPLAMNNSFVKLFARREADKEVIAMLMDVEASYTKIVICRREELLFARMVPIGFRQLVSPEMVNKLIIEADACCRYLESLSKDRQVKRLLFFAGKSTGEAICHKVSKLAEKLRVPAQIGDVLAAVESDSAKELSIDRRRSEVDWSTSFGLSLAD